MVLFIWLYHSNIVLYSFQPSKRLREHVESLINTFRTKLENALVGGEFRYKRRLKLIGMGLKIAAITPHPNPDFAAQRVLEFQLGCSHMIPVCTFFVSCYSSLLLNIWVVVYSFLFCTLQFAVPSGVQVKLLNKRGTGLRLFSSDYELIQNTTAEIRHLKPPEVYTGKGIVYHGEVVRRKEGKKK